MAIPAAHVLTVRLGFDGSLNRRVEGTANAERWIAEVMTHAQALLKHPSLPTEITLKVRPVFTCVNVKGGESNIPVNVFMV